MRRGDLAKATQHYIITLVNDNHGRPHDGVRVIRYPLTHPTCSTCTLPESGMESSIYQMLVWPLLVTPLTPYLVTYRMNASSYEDCGYAGTETAGVRAAMIFNLWRLEDRRPYQDGNDLPMISMHLSSYQACLVSTSWHLGDELSTHSRMGFRNSNDSRELPCTYYWYRA